MQKVAEMILRAFEDELKYLHGSFLSGDVKYKSQRFSDLEQLAFLFKSSRSFEVSEDILMNKIVQLLNENQSTNTTLPLSLNNLSLDSKLYDINWDDAYTVTPASKGIISFYSKHPKFTFK